MSEGRWGRGDARLNDQSNKSGEKMNHEVWQTTERSVSRSWKTEKREAKRTGFCEDMRYQHDLRAGLSDVNRHSWTSR